MIAQDGDPERKFSVRKLMAGGGGSEGPSPELARLGQSELNLAKVDLVFGVIVLLLKR